MFETLCASGWSTKAAAETAERQQPAAQAVVRVVENKQTGAYVFKLQEGRDSRPLLQYNYKTVPLPKGFLERVPRSSRKYARPRSDYIHPLYGPDGEILTADFRPDHPHHRGIYWAWPEVQFGQQLGDLHALQRVFARPTGNVQIRQQPKYAELTAENLWKWEDKTPIVRELATIRVYAPSAQGQQLVDLTFRFEGLVDGVTIARRHTNLYGGLNIRLAKVKHLQFIHHADSPGSNPQRAWSDAVGVWPGGRRTIGMAVLEKRTNPCYPGDWIEYTYLPWFQPTFPAANQRYPLKPGQPLTLQYRLWIRPVAENQGKAKPSEKEYIQQWDAYNRPEKQQEP